jgi:hypothetical protein
MVFERQEAAAAGESSVSLNIGITIGIWAVFAVMFASLKLYIYFSKNPPNADTIPRLSGIIQSRYIYEEIGDLEFGDVPPAYHQVSPRQRLLSLVIIPVNKIESLRSAYAIQPPEYPKSKKRNSI